jgi:hypothetical protein
MKTSVFQQPTEEQLAAFVSGDPLVIDEVVRLLLPQVYNWAVTKHRELPRQEVRSMVNQVFTEICINHNRYRPAESKLTTYIINLLRLRLNDLYRNLGVTLSIDELGDEAYENLDLMAYNSSEDKAAQIVRKDFFREVSEQLDPAEKEFLDLMRKGEKSQSIFADVLVHHKLASSAKDVKNMKERLQRKMYSIAADKGYKFEDLAD